MDYKFYVIEGAEAQKLIEEHEFATKKFHERREDWEVKYAPFLVTNKGFVVGVNKSNRLANPKEHGLCKEYFNEGNYFYKFRKSSMEQRNKHYDMYSSYQELKNSEPDFEAMVEKVSALDIHNLIFGSTRGPMGGVIAHKGVAYICDEVLGIIFCKIPVSSEAVTQKSYPSFVREVKESEWLALMGK